MIELRHLRYFIAVAEELNFHRAAERVHIDQSPLSRAVRDMEEYLGVQLFSRTPRSLRITPAGTRMLDEARGILAHINQALRSVREVDARYRAPLRIGIADGIAQPKLVRCFAEWQALAPETPLEMIEMRGTELVAALRREDVDAGFTFGVLDDDGIAQEPVWNYLVVAILSPMHELVTRTELPLSELLAFPVIACDPTRQPGLRRQMDAVRERHGFTPTIAGEARTLTGYVTRVAAGQGVGVADAGHMETLRRSDVAVVPLTEEIHFTTYVLYKHQRFGLPAVLQRFLTHAKSLH